MVANFYNYGGDPLVLDKSLGNAVYTVSNMVPYEILDDTHAKLILDYNTNLDLCNYVVTNGKNYFITSRSKQTGHKIELICEVDVLMTYNTAIKELNVLVKRTSADPEKNETAGWNSLLDDQYAVTTVNTKEFEVGLGENSTFAYDPRPYFAAIGYEPPDSFKESVVQRIFPIYS